MASLLETINKTTTKKFNDRLDDFARLIKDDFAESMSMCQFEIEYELTKVVEVAYHEKITYAEAIERCNDRSRNGDNRPYSEVLRERAETDAKRAEEAAAAEQAEHAAADEHVADEHAEEVVKKRR